MAVAEKPVDIRIKQRQTTVVPSTQDLYLQHPLVQSVLHILTELALSNGMRLVQTSESEPITETERALFNTLVENTSFNETLKHLLSAHLFGCAAALIVWQEFVPSFFIPVPNRYYQVGLDTNFQPALLKLSHPNIEPKAIPPQNFLILVIGATLENPLGVSRIALYKQYLDAYDTTVKSLSSYIQRHGVPTIIAQVPENFNEVEVRDIYNKLVQMQSSLVAVIPTNDTFRIEFLEPKGSGMDVALDSAQLLERLFVRSILGSILAIYEAQYGTRAQAQVHWELMRRLIEGMQRPLETVLNQQLWTRLVGYHQPTRTSRVELVEPSLAGVESVLRNLGDLVALGIVDPEADKEWLRGFIKPS